MICRLDCALTTVVVDCAVTVVAVIVFGPRDGPPFLVTIITRRWKVLRPDPVLGHD